jgi:serine/threonine protein kinase
VENIGLGIESCLDLLVRRRPAGQICFIHISFLTGDIYRAKNVITGQEHAVKLEAIDAEVPKLVHEWEVYKLIGSGTGIPRIRWCGTENNYRAIVMTLLGPSLEDLFNACGRKFSLKTVLQLADQLVSQSSLFCWCWLQWVL